MFRRVSIAVAILNSGLIAHLSSVFDDEGVDPLFAAASKFVIVMLLHSGLLLAPRLSKGCSMIRRLVVAALLVPWLYLLVTIFAHVTSELSGPFIRTAPTIAFIVAEIMIFAFATLMALNPTVAPAGQVKSGADCSRTTASSGRR